MGVVYDAPAVCLKPRIFSFFLFYSFLMKLLAAEWHLVYI